MRKEPEPLHSETLRILRQLIKLHGATRLIVAIQEIQNTDNSGKIVTAKSPRELARERRTQRARQVSEWQNQGPH